MHLALHLAMQELLTFSSRREEDISKKEILELRPQSKMLLLVREIPLNDV
jgi:hypothetical protein